MKEIITINDLKIIIDCDGKKGVKWIMSEIAPKENADYIIWDIEEAMKQAYLEDLQRDRIAGRSFDEKYNVIRDENGNMTEQKMVSSETSNKKKGNFAEMAVDVEMSKNGWVRMSKDDYGFEKAKSINEYREKSTNGDLNSDSVTSFEDKGHLGIDGVYMRYDNNTQKTEYCIVESKYGTSQLSKTKNGTKQMSVKWIYGELEERTSAKGKPGRLEKVVGIKKAKEIRAAADEGNVLYMLARVDKDREGNPVVEFSKI